MTGHGGLELGLNLPPLQLNPVDGAEEGVLLDRIAPTVPTPQPLGRVTGQQGLRWSKEKGGRMGVRGRASCCTAWSAGGP